MPILAIDTSTQYLSLALHAHGETQLYHAEAGNHQSEHILPQIQALFAQAQIQAADLSAIVYAQGAGAFTGLRIGIGIAQGIATPYNTPLIGIPCQDAVAYQIPNHPCVLAATDARMGEVFYAFFNTQTHQRLSDYQVAKPANIRQPENIPADAVIGIGIGIGIDIDIDIDIEANPDPGIGIERTCAVRACGCRAGCEKWHATGCGTASPACRAACGGECPAGG